MNKNDIRQTNGITLIALIITIIVMLLLVAVTITIAVNGGLFNYARQAKMMREIARYTEELEQARTEAKIQTYIDDVDILTETRARISNNGLFANATIGQIANNQFTVTTEEGYEFLVTENGVEYVGISLDNGTGIEDKISLTIRHLDITTGNSLIEEQEVEYNVGEVATLESQRISGYKVTQLIFNDQLPYPLDGPTSLSFQINANTVVLFKYQEVNEGEDDDRNRSGASPVNAQNDDPNNPPPPIRTSSMDDDDPALDDIPNEAKNGDDHMVQDIKSLTPINGDVTLVMDVSEIAVPGDSVYVWHKKNNTTWENVINRENNNNYFIVDSNSKITIIVDGFSTFYVSADFLELSEDVEDLTGTSWRFNKDITYTSDLYFQINGTVFNNKYSYRYNGMNVDTVYIYDVFDFYWNSNTGHPYDNDAAFAFLPENELGYTPGWTWGSFITLEALNLDETQIPSFTITGGVDATNPDTIEWLQNNARRIE